MTSLAGVREVRSSPALPRTSSRRGGSARRPIPLTGFLLVLLAIPALVDAPARINLGPLSLMGLLSIVQAGLTAVAVIACGRYPHRLVCQWAPYAMFLSWAGLSAVWAAPTFGGAQNAVVYLLFGLAVLLSGTLATARPEAVHGVIASGVSLMDRIGLPVALASVATAGLPNDEAQWLVGPRAFALAALIPISWHVAHWHAGHRGSFLRGWLWLTAVGLSLSRTALAISLLYVMAALALQLRLTPRSLLIRVPAGALGIAASAAFVLNTGAIEERLFTGDTSLELGGVAINMSGRLSMWPLIVDSARESPLIGKGLGSSQVTMSVFDHIAHPHNDYLRLWHDVGAVGLLLLLSAFGTWLCCLGVYWRRSARRRSPQTPMQMAAFFAAAGLLLAALTDNAIIYPFVMGPLGVLVGAGLGAGGDVEPHVWRS